MWRCAKCNFLYTASESPKRCEICDGEGFIRIVIAAHPVADQRPPQCRGESA